MAGILEGIKVISMVQIVAIPAASWTLADWGAEVIKLEPLTGEMHRGTRRVQGVETGTHINWVIQVLNRNSKGLAIYVKKEPGREIVYKLVRKADIFMSNYERGAVKRLKLDYATLSQLNPRLIYAFVSGYGAVGPDKDERGYDFTAGWARSGMMHLIGEPGNPPAPQRVGMIDSVAGAHIVGAVCAALLQREKTGEGQGDRNFTVSRCCLELSVWISNKPWLASSLSNTTALKRKIRYGTATELRTTGGSGWQWRFNPTPPGPVSAELQTDLSWKNDPRFNSLEARRENRTKN